MGAAEPERRKPPRLAFGRDRRLPNRADFQRVYENGQKAGGRFATVFCLRRALPDGGEADLPWRLGITASRKAARRAIDRNRGRRLLREYFRLHQARIASGWDIVVNMKPGLARAKMAELKPDLDRTLARLNLAPEEPARPRA